MIIARIFPKKSNYFQKLQPIFVDIGKTMDSKGWIRLFSLWSLIVAGIVAGLGTEDRYVYWNWIGWEHRVQKSDAGVGIGTLVGANAPTPPYGGGLAPPTPPLMVGASAPTRPLSRPVGLPNGH